MNMPLQPMQVPLYLDENGGCRVVGTRVLLEMILHAFDDGATPEEIVVRFDTLTLADVYAVATWYLANRDAAKEYLAEREAIAAEVVREIRQKQPSRADIAARLHASQSLRSVCAIRH